MKLSVEIRSNGSSPNTSVTSKPSYGTELELLMEALNCLETPEQVFIRVFRDFERVYFK